MREDLVGYPTGITPHPIRIYCNRSMKPLGKLRLIMLFVAKLFENDYQLSY